MLKSCKVGSNLDNGIGLDGWTSERTSANNDVGHIKQFNHGVFN